MLENTSAPSNSVSRSEARQVKALLRLMKDLGYEMDTDPAGQYVVSTTNEHGERRIVGVDSAREVSTAARILAESLQADCSLTTAHSAAR